MGRRGERRGGGGGYKKLYLVNVGDALSEVEVRSLLVLDSLIEKKKEKREKNILKKSYSIDSRSYKLPVYTVL